MDEIKADGNLNHTENIQTYYDNFGVSMQVPCFYI